MKIKIYTVLSEHGGITELACVTAIEKEAVELYHRWIVLDMEPAEDQATAEEDGMCELIDGTWYRTYDEENTYRLEVDEIEVPALIEALNTLEAISNDCTDFLNDHSDMEAEDLFRAISDSCDKLLPPQYAQPLPA